MHTVLQKISAQNKNAPEVLGPGLCCRLDRAQGIMQAAGEHHVLKRLRMVSSLSSARPLVFARFSSRSNITSCAAGTEG